AGGAGDRPLGRHGGGRPRRGARAGHVPPGCAGPARRAARPLRRRVPRGPDAAVNPRLFDRLAAAASVLILVGLGMLSYFLAQQAERLARPSVARPVSHEPDYFVEQLRLLKANAAGDPAVRVEALHMRHYPDDRTIEFDQPNLVTLT